MAKTSRPLYGTSKDAYFRRLLRAEPGVGAAASERILRRLQAEVVQVRLREGEAAAVPAPDLGMTDVEPAAAATIPTAAQVIAATGGTAVEPPPEFDPFTPNVVVLVRTGGRERALAALAGIERIEHLKLLAREQQLSIDAALEAAADIRSAIVAAAERRIANRRAAAGA